MSLRKMQSALPDLIGRTIKHVIVSEHADNRTQVFLYFTDGTYYEFYGAWIDGIRHLSQGGLEISRGCGVIPEFGMLEVLSESSSRVIERPAPPAVPSATTPSRTAPA